MKKHKTYTIAHRRKREGKTDYRKRLRLLLSGKPRLVIRMSLYGIIAQIIEYSNKGDKVIVAVKSNSLRNYGWKFNYRNTSSAYLLGLIIGKKAKDKGINEAILDIGLRKPVPGSRIYAVLKGALDSGLNVPHSDTILPSENRIQGKHIENYAQENKEKFSGYIKNGLDPAIIPKTFVEVKNKILGK